MIAAALGNQDDAKRSISEALAIGPMFDPLQASHARAQLARLQ
jgi:hypothetical protein